MSSSVESESVVSETEALRIATITRVSSDKQATGGGLDAQDRIIEQTLSDIDQDVSVVLQIEEEGVSGTNFPRPSLLKILAYARKERLDAIAVKDVSRIGRLAAPTFGFIWQLNTRFNIDLVVEDGRYNVQRKADLIQMFFRTLNAELKNRFRTSYVHESQLEEFRQGNFHVTGRNVRFGYKKTQHNVGNKIDNKKGRIEEGDEIEIYQKEAEAIKNLFQAVVEVGPLGNAFARAREKVANELSSERLPKKDINIKELLRNPIYRGRPTWEINAATGDQKSATVKREDLRIVEDQTFEKVQNILDKRDEQYANDSSNGKNEPDRLTIQQISSLVGLSRLVAFDDVVRIHCPDCGKEMCDNGKWRATSDISPSNIEGVTDEPILKRYSCPNDFCERSEKRFPNEFEAYLLFSSDISLNELMEHSN